MCRVTSQPFVSLRRKNSEKETPAYAAVTVQVGQERASFPTQRNPLWRKECCSRSLDADDGDGTHSRENPPNKNKGKIEKKNRILMLSREGCFFLLKCRSKSKFLWVNVGES